MQDLDAFKKIDDADIELYSSAEEFTPDYGNSCQRVEVDVRINSGRVHTLKMENRCCGDSLFAGNLTFQRCECFFSGKGNGGLVFGDLCEGNIVFSHNGELIELVTTHYVSKHRMKAKVR